MTSTGAAASAGAAVPMGGLSAAPPTPETTATATAANAPATPAVSPSTATPANASAVTASPPVDRPRPTLNDVEQLDAQSDYRAFVAQDVDPAVRNAAFRKLFHSDPHFNVMDGLDVYIDDYNTPMPLSKAVMQTLRQARVLGLIDDDLKEQDLPPPDPPIAPPASSEQAQALGSDEAVSAAPAGAHEADRVGEGAEPGGEGGSDGSPDGGQAVEHSGNVVPFPRRSHP